MKTATTKTFLASHCERQRFITNHAKRQKLRWNQEKNEFIRNICTNVMQFILWLNIIHGGWQQIYSENSKCAKVLMQI